jgi:hypothetical protein
MNAGYATRAKVSRSVMVKRCPIVPSRAGNVGVQSGSLLQ